MSFGPASIFAPGATVPVGFDGPGPNPLLQNHILCSSILRCCTSDIRLHGSVCVRNCGAYHRSRWEGWLLETRRWALLSWGLLTIGILLGGWWSYEVLGWSGVWAWDPVENASLLPRLTGTVVHSVLVQQRRNVAGVESQPSRRNLCADHPRHVPPRSGVINSVHATGEIDGYLLDFWWWSSLGLIGWRGDALRAWVDRLTGVT